MHLLINESLLNRTILIVSVILLIATLASCNKDDWKKEAIIGTWVSVDRADTLVFLNEECFEKNLHPGNMDLFLYSIEGDTIKIQYSGVNYICIIPSAHYFELEDNDLRIDFSNGCYGFPRKKMEYYSAELQ